MKTGVATSHPVPEAKPAQMAIDDTTMHERLTEYLSIEAGGAVEIETFERRSPGFSWITYSFIVRDRFGQKRKLILRVGPTNGLFGNCPISLATLNASLDTRKPKSRRDTAPLSGERTPDHQCMKTSRRSIDLKARF